MSSSSTHSITECDDAGSVTVTYLASAGGSRVDVIYPPTTKTYAQRLLDVFLPVGFPHSVSEDYVQYQIYDSLQAFSSSIAGMLASRAVLEGVGVGDPLASPTTALLLSALQSSTGRLATILSAHRLGPALSPECKTYRLAADVLNDCALVLDCLSPAFPKPLRVAVLSGSGVLRALCGVCAGSAKASLGAHFARRGNLGEVNAKDSSQETVISLLGMLAGSVVVSWVSRPIATWTTLIALLSVHLATNYTAVRAVQMRCLNRQRANIVFSNILQHGVVLSPREVSERERIFERDGVLRWAGDEIVGYCRIGGTLEALLHCIGARHQQTGSVALRAVDMSALLEIFADEAYILSPFSSDHEALIILKNGCTPIDQLQAWAHALLVAGRARGRNPGGEPEAEGGSGSDRLAELGRTLVETKAAFGQYAGALRDKGWDLEVAALETRAGARIEIDAQKEM